VQPGDEVWLISTRNLTGCGYYDGSFAPNYYVQRYEAGGWQHSSLEEYYATQSAEALTVAHVHGNRYELSDALERGWQTYHIVRQCKSAWERVRMVIWTWPSDRIQGPLRDLRTKAARTDIEGYYLGYFLAHHNADSQISVMGHSYGSRVVCGGLHIMAGGRLCHGYLRNPPTALPPTRALVIAAAMENTWLAQGQYYGRAFSAVQNMRIVYNPRDCFLIRYAILVKGSKPQALGVTGPVGYLGEARQRIELYNANPYIGSAHYQKEYYVSAPIRQLIHDHVTWKSAAAQ
jgi:hypothetical protein